MKHFFSLRPWILATVVLASTGTTVAARGKMEAYPASEKWFVSGSVGAGVYVGGRGSAGVQPGHQGQGIHRSGRPLRLW